MDEKPAAPAAEFQHLSPKMIWTWLFIAAAVPFVMLLGIIILMINLDFNFLEWME